MSVTTVRLESGATSAMLYRADRSFVGTVDIPPRSAANDEQRGGGAVEAHQSALRVTHLKQPDPSTGEIREAVVLILYPPTELRDAPREVVEHVVMRQKASLLASIVEEIYRSFTSDPVDGAAARNIADALNRHADTQRQG